MTNSKPEDQLLNQIEIEAQERGRRWWGLIPIAKSEVKKLFCIGGITFFLSFAYSSSRELKDSYFLEKMPSTSISYVKLLFVLPLNIIVNISISILLNRFSVEKIFEGLTLFYSIYFFIMGLFLIPWRNSLEMSIFTTIDLNCDSKIDFYGSLNGILPIFYLCGYWIVSLNYCFIEVFSSTVFAYLMFTFFNYVCNSLQFKRFISLIFIFCNIAAIFSGIILSSVSKLSSRFEYAGKQKLYYVYFCFVALFCLLAFILQKIINKYYNENIETKVIKKKETPSILDSLKVLLGAKVILALSVIVILYNFLVNVVEMDYKSNLKRYQSYYLNGSESMQNVTAKFQSWALIITGCSVILIMLSPLKNAVSKYGWSTVGLATPIMMLIGGSIVLILSLYNFTKSATPKELTTILAVKIGKFFKIKVADNVTDAKNSMISSLWVSCVLISLFKCFKYAFFDISKEAFSMLIDKTERAKYKSIYDGVCGKLGKSLSSLYVIFWVNILSAKDANEFSVVSAVFLFSSIILWCLLVFYIGSAYNTSIKTGKPMDLGISKPKSSKNI